MSESSTDLPIEADDTTDITLAPDGRVFVSGASWPVVELLAEIGKANPRLVALLSQLKSIEMTSHDEPVTRNEQS